MSCGGVDWSTRGGASKVISTYILIRKFNNKNVQWSNYFENYYFKCFFKYIT